MRLTTTLLLGALTTLTTALPTPPVSTNPLTKKSTCTAVPPPPTAPRLNILNRPDLNLTTTQSITFTLPAPADPARPLPGPCTLRARFPPRWEVVDTSVQRGGPPLVVNVYAEDGPAAGALVGSARFASADPGMNDASGDRPERVVVVNSFACRGEMGFRFELVGEGELGFANGFDEGLGVAGGLEMVYGC